MDEQENNNVTPFPVRKADPKGWTGLGSMLGNLARDKEDFAERMKRVRERMPRPESEEYRVDAPRAKNTWICPHCSQETDGVNAHGWFKDDAGKPVPCPVCSPTVKKARARRRSDRYINQLVDDFKFTNAQNLPVEAANVSLAWYPLEGDQKAKKYVQEFTDDSLKELLLIGDVGRGKSGLAISAVKAMAEAGEQVLFLTVSEYLRLLQENFSDGPDNNIRDAAKLVSILVLDDLGVDRPSPFVIQEVQDLIEARHNAGLRTLITSNYTLEGLAAYWKLPNMGGGFQPASRIVSRLRGWYQVVTFEGPDLRLGGE